MASANRPRIIAIIVANYILIAIAIVIISTVGASGEYLRFGWNDQLIIISIAINTFTRYIILLVIVAVCKIVETLSLEFADPLLEYRVYNPDITTITEFTRCELQILSNLNYTAKALRYVFMVILSVSQIDIALFSVFVNEITACISVHKLLNAKKFINPSSEVAFSLSEVIVANPLDDNF